MQIRQLSLKELYDAYEMVQHLYDISYDEFEDLIYEMKDNYTMIGIFEKETIFAYAGLSILTTLKDKRHIRVYEIYAKEQKYKQELQNYIEDYAKISAAKKVVYEN
ncbi:MAG: GNAT family N-acetyltransferase [Epsilonproteobacteria bacterium]|nr:GNAT family N-acetyltransferase [Campylobacterota bacterium]